MTKILPPAKNPCGSCPYRCDVEPGIWDETEYAKLPGFDNPQESYTVFLCHQQNGRFCAGWVSVHDMVNMLGLRIATAVGKLSEATWNAVMNYVSGVPVFRSGQEAADHGRSGIKAPSEKALKTVHKLLNQEKPVPRTFRRPTEEKDS